MRDTGLISIGRLYETTHCASYGHVTNDAK